MTVRVPGPLSSAFAVLRRFRFFVVILWLALVVVVNIFVPQLEKVIAGSPYAVLPDSTPSSEVLKKMDVAFGGTGARSVAFVVLVNDHGVNQADLAFYESLMQRLRADHKDVSEVMDFISDPALKPMLASNDGDAVYIPVGLSGSAGSPEATTQLQFVRAAAGTNVPPDLKVNVTGLSATFSDLMEEIQRNVVLITVLTVVVILCILLIIYRSVVTASIVLVTIGIALAAARGSVALLGEHVIAVSTFTGTFMTILVLGAGTDYAVFLIGRYHELRRLGVEPAQAARTASARVQHVIIASAATVSAATACMGLAQLGVFSTTGPAMALGVAATLITNLTVTPILLGLAARRGWAEPPRTGARRLWPAVGAAVTRRPAAMLAFGLVVLGLLAAAYPVMRTSFDERAIQPKTTDSNVGYQALGEHFPVNEALPGYLLISADHDLRNPRDLAALEQAADAVARVPGIAQVRGVTRPDGKPIDAASLGTQDGDIGRQLADAGRQVNDSRGGTQQLADGAEQVADGTHRLADDARGGLSGIDAIIRGMQSGGDGLSQAASGTGQARLGAEQLATAAQQLAAALHTAHDQTQVAVDGLKLAQDALTRDPLCTVDPTCAQARDGLQEIHQAEQNQLLPGLLSAAGAADQLASGNTTLANGLAQVRSGLTDAQSGVDSLIAAQQRLRDGVVALANGAGQLANGADQLSEGIRPFTQQQQKLSEGIQQAADFLQTAGRNASGPGVGGFYLPPGAIDDPRLALARGYFLSQDGKTARFVVTESTDPMGREAAARVPEIIDAAGNALRQTSMEGSRVESTGPPAVTADADRLANQDLQLIAVVTFLLVLLVLVIVLRSLVAPLYLLVSVAVSYAAAIGASVLFWQLLLGLDLDWVVPMFSFVVLVAVGADYNILLMTRIREEAPDGDRKGVAHVVDVTGGVITSAGVILAASFLVMLSTDVRSLAQTGFTIGVGLLLDTFVVRGVVVPAIVSLTGGRSWWPTRKTKRPRLVAGTKTKLPRLFLPSGAGR